MDESEKEGKIVIDADSPKEIKIQASLTASGKGFSIEGEAKTVHLLGSLQASDYDSNENKLKLTFDEWSLADNKHLENVPHTEKPVLYLSSFKIREWREI